MSAPISRRDALRWSLGALGAAAVPALASCSTGGSPVGQGAPVTDSPTPSPVPRAVLPTNPLTDADGAARYVLAMAQRGAAGGSYGIAGALVANDTGRVLHSVPNRVLRRLRPLVRESPGQTFTADPTAHGERQLVAWYFANRRRLGLPGPKHLTVVTSLDPCVMCAGELLTAGLNAAVVAMDDFSGINYAGDGQFADLPEPLRGQIKKRFGYYAVAGGRPYSGGSAVVFAPGTISASSLDGCEATYQASAAGVRQSRKETGTDPASLKDPATWAQAAPIRRAFTAADPVAFSVRVAEFRTPDDAVHRVLQRAVRGTPGATNACAFIDPFGNLLCAAAGPLPDDPGAAPMLTVAQRYSATRFALMNDKDTNLLAAGCLTSPKFGTFVWLRAPNPGEAATFAELGAFGSTMESAAPQPQPSPLQYFEPPAVGTIGQLREQIAALPPLYSQLVNIDPQPVRS